MSSQMMGKGVDYVATPRLAACRFWLHHSAMTWVYNSGPSRGGTTCRPSDPACTSTFSMTPHRDATSQRRCSCPRAKRRPKWMKCSARQDITPGAPFDVRFSSRCAVSWVPNFLAVSTTPPIRMPTTMLSVVMQRPRMDDDLRYLATAVRMRSQEGSSPIGSSSPISSPIQKRAPALKRKPSKERVEVMSEERLDPLRAQTQPWTPEEDRLIVEMVERVGHKWSAIATLLPGRTDNGVRNRWNRLDRCGTRRRASRLTPQASRLTPRPASSQRSEGKHYRRGLSLVPLPPLRPAQARPHVPRAHVGAAAATAHH